MTKEELKKEFEKVAEEYAQDMAMYYESAHGSIPSQFEKYLRNAVEYGYNKANEWHFVKDGDLPKVGVHVLSEKGTLVIYKGEGFNWVEYSPNADNIKLRKWEEPIAWKEIVLPKESE